MEDSCVHHVEFGVRDGEGMKNHFIEQYRFSLHATRVTKNLKQWVLKSGTGTVLLTQRAPRAQESTLTDPYHVGWDMPNTCLQSGTSNSFDSVFNVALKVKDLSSCIQKLTRSNVEVIQPPQTYRDDQGEISLAIVRSCIGNVVHTIIQDEGYRGTFLPDFVRVKPSAEQIENQLITHFDHVTFACACGQADEVLDWYSRCFGMRRFLINRYFYETYQTLF